MTNVISTDFVTKPTAVLDEKPYMEQGYITTICIFSKNIHCAMPVSVAL